MESQADLEAKIALYNQQLSQVEELLQLDGTNTQFIKLKDDLHSLIALTRALLVKAIGESAVSSSSAGVSSSSANILPSASQPLNSGTASIRKGPIQVGEVVEVIGGERLYAGVVTGIINQTEYKVKYYEYPDEVSLPVTSLQRPPLAFYAPDQVTVGMNCQCKYATDQNYYDCKVTAITPNGCVVTYTQYGNTEEVPVAYLKPITSAAKPNALSGKSAGKHTTTGGLIPIPESLQILPTDTEKVKVPTCRYALETLCTSTIAAQWRINCPAHLSPLLPHSQRHSLRRKSRRRSVS
jgi:hypothetical protein